MAYIGRQWVLSIGVNDYGAQVALPNLRCAVNDACAFYRVLVREYGFQGILLAQAADIAAGNYPELASESAGAGTREEIVTSVNQLRRIMRQEDMFVLFFAGHGIPHGPGYMAPFGAEAGRVASYLMYQNLFGELSALPCRHQMLILNCCFARVQAGGRQLARRARRNDGCVVAFAATNDGEVTPDHVPGIGEDHHSPFGAELIRFLTESVERGESFDARQMAVHVSKVLSGLEMPDGYRPLRPEFRPQVPEVRSGDEAFVIRRPWTVLRAPKPVGDGSWLGLSSAGISRYRCEVGEPLELLFSAYGASQGEAELYWQMNYRLAEQIFRAEANRSLGDGRWLLQFRYAGCYLFDVQVKDGNTGEEAAFTIDVEVVPSRRVLSLDPGPLPICQRGKDYKADVVVRNGVAPYRWRIDGMLPDRISSNADEGAPLLILSGHVPAPRNAGMADCADGQPVAYPLRVEVTDAAGNQVAAFKRLLVVSEADYCLIPKGKFHVGYSSSLEQDAAILTMVEGHIRRRIVGGYTGDPLINGAVRRWGPNAAKEIVTQVIEANQGSHVTLPGAFYIRKYPVTNAEWREFIRATRHTPLPSHWGSPPDFFTEDEAKLPIVNVAYEEICRYLEWKGTRLPSAWEWERAARGEDGWLFPWGDDFDPGWCNVWDSWQKPESRYAYLGELMAVDAHDQAYTSAEGVHDIVGNAAEWVDRRVYSLSQRTLFNVFRGGSYQDSCLYALTFRDSDEAGIAFGAGEGEQEVGQTAFEWLGFRDVIDLDLDPDEEQGLIHIPERDPAVRGGDSPVAPFAMSRYAVSNLEYLMFVQENDWPFPAHWTTGKEPPFPLTMRHLPVVNVSFHDALAFCLWKSRSMGRVIRLPTPQQWRAAAICTEEGRFPWGQEFDPQRCNLLTSGWGKKLPVFWLDDGQSREGVFNLVGNVREWCGSTSPRDPLYVLGGCWHDDWVALERSGFSAIVGRQEARRMKSTDIGFRYVEHYTNRSDGCMGNRRKTQMDVSQ